MSLDLIPLKNPLQSKTDTKANGCQGSECTADKAIDEMDATWSVAEPKSGSHSWWTAELTKYAKIEKVVLSSSSEKAFKDMVVNEFKVEISNTSTGSWKICKVIEMEEPFIGHVIRCAKPMTARYLRLSISTGKNLVLREVKVFGTEVKGKTNL